MERLTKSPWSKMYQDMLHTEWRIYKRNVDWLPINTQEMELERKSHNSGQTTEKHGKYTDVNKHLLNHGEDLKFVC